MNTQNNRASKPVMANVSNRHMHLCAADCEALFGPGYTLVKLKDLMQPGEHACRETVTIIGRKGRIDDVRVLGPLRPATQIEISMTDSFRLGVAAPVRASGDVAGTPGIMIVGPAGRVELAQGVIVAKRHVHMTTADAAAYGLTNGDIISVRTPGDRGLVFENVVARVSDKMALECHLDTDEANAAGLKNGTNVIIL